MVDGPIKTFYFLFFDGISYLYYDCLEFGIFLLITFLCRNAFTYSSEGFMILFEDYQQVVDSVFSNYSTSGNNFSLFFINKDIKNHIQP